MKKAINKSKKKANSMILFIIIMVSLIASSYLFSDTISKLMFNVPGVDDNISNMGTTQAVHTYYVLQLGAFANESNAKSMMKSLGSIDSFVIKDGNMFRVMAGIYNDNTIAKERTFLSSKKLPFSEIKSSINVSSNSMSQIVDISDSMLKIVSQFNDSTVDQISISDFKKWIRGLGDTNESNGANKTLKELKAYVLSLDDKLTRNKIQDINNNIYTFLDKVKQ